MQRRAVLSLRLARRAFMVMSLLLLGQFQVAGALAATADPANGSIALTNSLPAAVASGKATVLAPVSSSQMLRLVLGLQPPDMAGEEQFLQQLQDKKSPLFHHYLTADEWNARFSPPAAAEQAVVDWANAQGLTVTQRYTNRLLVDVAAPVGTIDRALGVQLNTYRLGSTTFYANDRAPTIPANLSGIVHAVLGLNSLEVAQPSTGTVPASPEPTYSSGPVAASGPGAQHDGSRTALLAALKQARAGHPQQAGAPTPGVTSGFYDPTDLYNSNAYDWDALDALGHCCNPFHNPSTVTPPATSIAIATSGDFQQSDLNGFVGRYTYLAYHYQSYYIDGTPSCCNGETTLDVEWATAMANSFGCYCDTAMVYVYEGADSKLSTFTDIYNQMLSDGHARSFSTSWGCTEESCASDGTMDTDHNIFNSMLGQGWTLSALTHDQGAYDDCTANTPKVDYPGSDPDVVAVGGSALNAFGSFVSEAAWTGPNNSCGGNAGGGGGGVSAHFGVPGYQSGMGYSARTTPDVVLNAYYGENTYFNGGWGGFGGTSIATPEVAAFFAQENAYLLSLGNACGTPGAPTGCGTVGEADYAIYNNARGQGAGTPPHNPYYDITSGCNGNGDGTGYCAGAGYDLATGWGSFNALQMAWALNWQITPDQGYPAVTFSGPATNTWYHTDQTVSWTVADTGGGAVPSGVAGFSQAWDADPGNPNNPGTPGSGNTFYAGPQFPNATSGYLSLAAAGGQGCHRVNVRAWDNMGLSLDSTYGSLCYDTITPHTTASLAPAANGAGWNSGNFTVTLSARDPGYGFPFFTGSGVAHTYYHIGACRLFCFYSTYSGPFTVSSEGQYTIYFYSVDNAGNAEALQSVSVKLDKTAPQTTAALAGTPAGGGNYLSPVTVTLAATDNLSGVANTAYQLDSGASTPYSAPFSVSALGPHTVSYHSVDKAGNAESAHTISFTIVRYRATTTTMSGVPNPTTFGQTVAFSVTVQPQAGSGTPTGTITFKDGATVLGSAALASGHASFSTSSLGVGAHAIAATYGGDAVFGGSVALTSHTVTSKVTLTSSANPSVFGQAVTFAATVSPAPASGTVTFKDGATVLGTVALAGGHASLSTAGLAVGVHSLSASFSGGGTSGPLGQTVNRAASSTALSSSLNPSVFGQAVTFTATVGAVAPGAGTPTGTVTFKDGATTLGTVALSGGHASLSTSALAAGAHSLSATYNGDAHFAPGARSILQIVGRASTSTALASSVNPSVFGQAVTFTATVSAVAPGAGTPTGTVTFKDGATVLGTVALSGGHASLSTSALAAGAHSLSATYNGAANFNGSARTLGQTVSRAGTTTGLTGSPNPATHGTAVSFTASVHAVAPGVGTPTGTVTFKDGATTLGTVALSGGVAKLATAGLAVGTHSITASYAGDAHFNASIGTVSETVT